MRYGLRACFAAVAIFSNQLSLSPTQAAVASSSDKLTEVSCDGLPGFSERSVAERERLRCGRLSVPLDRAKPAGRSINMSFVVRRAEQPSTRPPVLVLAGSGSGSVRWATNGSAPPYPTDRTSSLSTHGAKTEAASPSATRPAVPKRLPSQKI